MKMYNVYDIELVNGEVQGISGDVWTYLGLKHIKSPQLKLDSVQLVDAISFTLDYVRAVDEFTSDYEFSTDHANLIQVGFDLEVGAPYFVDKSGNYYYIKGANFSA